MCVSVFRPSSFGAESVVEGQQQRTHRRRSQRGIWAGTSAKRGASLGSLAPRFETPLFWVLSPARTALDAALRTGRGGEEHPVQISSLPSPIHASGGPTTGFPLRYPGTVCTMKARGGGGGLWFCLWLQRRTHHRHIECSRSLFCLARWPALFFTRARAHALTHNLTPP